MAFTHQLALPVAWQHADIGTRPARWEKALAVAGLLILLGAFRTILLQGGDTDRTGGNTLFQLVSGATYLSAILALLTGGIPAWVFKVLVRSWPLVVLTLLPLLSTLWSQAPEATFRRAAALLLSATFAVFLIVRFNPRTLFNLLAVSFAIFVVLGVVAAAVPGLGITNGGAYDGAWRGLTGNKNVFGRSIALAVALLPPLAVLGLVERQRWVLLVSAVALVLLFLSNSATSLVAAFAGVAVGATLYLTLGGRIGGVRLRPTLGLPLLAIAVTAGALIVTFGWSTILEALGRDPTLTGRTKLWEWAMNVNATREWFGSGYRAFWINANTKYFFEAFAWGAGPDGRSESYTGPTHAHSGYIDTYLELGQIGVIVLGLTIFSALFVIRRVIARGNYEVGFIFAVILSFLLVYAITARSFLQQSEDLWILFTALYLLSVKEGILNAPSSDNLKRQGLDGEIY